MIHNAFNRGPELLATSDFDKVPLYSIYTTNVIKLTDQLILFRPASRWKN